MRSIDRSVQCKRICDICVKRTMSKKGVHAEQMNWIPNEEFIHCQPVAIQNGILQKNPRADLETIPQLTDNPLFEGSNQEQHYATSRLSVEESQLKSVTRRGSLSLSAKDYEGIWRAVQEDVSKSSNESKSPLEDFNEFRQKLALLKQDMTGPTTTGGSGVTSSASTRSLNITPSRPTSPLKRLSVITSRRIATSSGLNPQMGTQQRVLPTVQKIAVTMRAEGLFKLPSPASISPAPQSEPTHPTTPPLRASTPTTKRRFSVTSYRIDCLDLTSSAESSRTDLTSKSRGKIPEGREVPAVSEVREGTDGHSRRAEDISAGNFNEEPDQSKKSGEAQVQAQAGSESKGQHSKRWGSASSTASERESTSQCNTTSSIRRLPVPCGGFKAPKTPPQQVQSKKGCAASPRDWKARCIPIPRPVCYTASILE